MTTLKLGGDHPHRGSGVSCSSQASVKRLTKDADALALVAQVAASDRLLAYSLSAGLVRVVNLDTGGRSLLRSHTAEVCGVQVRRVQLQPALARAHRYPRAGVRA